MNKLKHIVNIADKLSEYILTATEECLDENEKDDLYSDLFNTFYKIFLNYDKGTLETLNKNL